MYKLLCEILNFDLHIFLQKIEVPIEDNGLPL